MKYLIPFLKIVAFGIIPADVPVSPNLQSTDVKSSSLFKLTAPNSITPKRLICVDYAKRRHAYCMTLTNMPPLIYVLFLYLSMVALFHLP